MARQAIVLAVQPTSGGDCEVVGVFWLAVPAGLVVPNPDATTVVPTLAAAPKYGYTPDELAALQAGTIREVAFNTGQYPLTTSDADWQAIVQGLFDVAQAKLNAQAPAAELVGLSYDPTLGVGDKGWVKVAK